MASYGRLEVFFPDGLHKTFILTEENVSIGRQPGNVIALDTDTISRYHLIIAHHDGQTTLTDLESANGTFVDGTRLQADQKHLLIGGEEILIGDLRLFYYNFDESPTRPNAPLPEEALRPVEAERATFQIEVSEPEIAVPPGAHTSAELRVVNRANTSERFVVEVAGVPRAWVRVDRPEFDLRTDEPVFVQIGFKPLRQPTSVPGDYPVTITVRPRNDPAQAVQCVVTLRVLPYGGFGMALEKRALTAGQPFRLHLHNQGSSDLPLTMTARDLGNQLRFTLTPDRAVLTPDQRLVVNGSAAPRANRLFGSAKRYPFDLIAHSGDAAGFVVAQRASVTYRPPLPLWSMYALLALAGLLLIGVIVLMVLATRPAAAPTITDFRLQPLELAAGDPLQAQWEVLNAESIVLSINDTPAATLEGEETSATIQTDGLQGSVIVALQAIGPGGEARAETTVVIAPGLAVDTFNTDIDTLVRYVVQPVTFAWSAPGAVSARLRGTQALSATSPADVLPPEGTFSVNAYVISPEPEILVTLYAEDAMGGSVQQSLSITVIDPLCRPPADASLYASPSRTAQVISTVPATTAVIVDARNTRADWLRVQLGGVRGWGEAADFVCSDNFSISGLQPDPTVREEPVTAVTGSPAPTGASSPPAPTRTAPPVQIQANPPTTPTPTAGG